jgi:hypothetical protein
VLVLEGLLADLPPGSPEFVDAGVFHPQSCSLVLCSSALLTLSPAAAIRAAAHVSVACSVTVTRCVSYLPRSNRACFC